MSDRRTSYARAAAGYDEAFERELLEAITRAIADASMVSDCNAIVLRTAETASALLTALAGMLAMSPAATRSPTEIRRTCDALHKKLRRLIAQAERDAHVQDFVARVFRGANVRGRA
jgi:hypothetical protein